MAKILIVDDHTRILQLMQQFLEPNGYTVIPTTSGTSAIEMARRDTPDLILCDLSLPDMSGVEVLRKLRGDATLPIIPFVLVVTATPGPAENPCWDPREAIKLGAEGYMYKPFNPQDLRDVVHNALKGLPVPALQKRLLKGYIESVSGPSF